MFLSATNFDKTLFSFLKKVIPNIKKKVSKDLAKYRSPIIRLKDSSSQDAENNVLNILDEISLEIK